MWNPFRKSDYRKGYEEGRNCMKTVALYDSSSEYKRGWDEGFEVARAKAKAAQTSRSQQPDGADDDSPPAPMVLMLTGVLDPDGKQDKES